MKIVLNVNVLVYESGGSQAKKPEGMRTPKGAKGTANEKGVILSNDPWVERYKFLLPN